ncbi:protein of unknown function [Tistlia consotensis]|uniref:DUF1127 domain-containing protein n=1 Tax=Tistlia consotensis USBA 355 TaxID=560819 RepID=A0A1Y6BVM7_9PROT|nr:DUF1127 domain-containing protein [Tistlia consotensis]SMF29629.1 protein of unknown function [Tistlia consotensis USBA 355]SNR91074.1 protein of unknown function [Tistlia consotensis]
MTANFLDPSDFPASPLRRFGQAIAELRQRALLAADRRARIARIVRELESYSDRGLADLGVARCDIPRIARASVDGARPAR